MAILHKIIKEDIKPLTKKYPKILVTNITEDTKKSVVIKNNK